MNGLHDLLFERAEEILISKTDGTQDAVHWMMGKLPSSLSAAYLLGTLNYQVENGGFNQWITNGNCLDIYTIIRLLENVVRKPASMQLAVILRKITPYIDLFAARNGSFGNYLKNSTDEREFRKFDEPYYSLRNELHAEWEDFFHKMLYGVKTQWELVPRLVDCHLVAITDHADAYGGIGTEVECDIDPRVPISLEDNNGVLSGTIYVGY